MDLKRCYLASLLIVLLSFFTPLSVSAEFECESKVSYSWEYTPPAMPQPQKPGKNSDAVIKVKKEKFTVPYVTRRLRSATAEEGKQKFRAVLDRDIEEAMSECRETHENLSGCVSAKFLSMGNVMRQLGFQARKELETSISRDCSMMTGRCLEATASEVTCVEVIQPMEEKKSEGEEEAAKDKKPKKK